MPSVGFARPEALPLLLAVGLLAGLAAWSEVRRTRALAAFAGRSAELSTVSARRRRIKLALALGAAALVVLALAGPYVDVVKRRVSQSGVDVVVALDVSQSMATRDVDPDRLRVGKEVIRRLGDELTQSRVSLVLFAGDGIVRYPATDDPTVLGQTLDSVSPAFKPQGGSSLRAAVDAALLAFSDEARASLRHKAVILVTDGEDLSGQLPDADLLRQRGVRVFTLGVGTTNGGPVPVYDRTGKFLSYLKRNNGEQIVSRLTEAPLTSLAEKTEGRYWHVASPLRTALELSTELKRLDAVQLGDVDGGTVPDDRYQLFLVLALAALIAEGLLTDRRDMPHPTWLRAPTAGPRRRTLVPAFVRSAAPWLLVLALGACSQISTSDADAMYAAGNAQGALDRYRALLADHPAVSELHVNAGNALHQLTQYGPALQEYAVALKDGGTHVRAVAQYQKGNTLFRMGKLEEAREAYKDALRLDPADRDAKFNIELIDRAIAVTEERPGQGAPQPGQSGRPNPGDQQGQSSGQDPSGQQQGAPAGQQKGQTGGLAPQSNGPPTTDTDQSGPTVTDALRQFRSTLTADEALQLLDALMSEQRGIQQLIEGVPPTQQRPGQPPQDPTY